MDAHSGSTSSWDYLDFELEIRGGGPREYPVAVRSPAGEAQGQMRFPFDEWELKDRLQALEIALLRSGGTRRRIASPEEHTVQDFGRGLFESLLVGDVRTRYEMSLSEARRQGKGLRLKLRIQPSELAVLPWEFLYDAERDRYPSLSSNTPLVRYLDLPQPVEPLRVSPPLRVLGMVTSPMGLDPLDVEHEKRLVEEATRGLREDGLLELTWLEGQTWRHLQRAMRRGPWHIFHFVGHGGFDPATEEGAIALSNDAGHMHLLRARSLAELLDDHYPLRLVFLNSCEGARGSESDAFSSTAATLVRRGVPAVVAMQYEITDKAAIEFSRDFYEALADSLPVDAAVTEARAAVSMDSILEWGTPVLYMHSPNGRVFDVLAAAPREHPPPEPEESQEVDSLRRYREGVASAWVDGKLQVNEVQRLRDLADNELGLSPGTAADIEHEVMGDTIEAILERQEEAAREEERNRRLEELHTQARRLHRDRKWQAVIDVFEQIRAEDPAYADREGLLASAREALEAQEFARRVATLYAEGQRHMDAREWQQALERFEEVQRLEPGYQETETLLSQVRKELAPPPRVEVPGLVSQEVSRARSTLANKGLKLGAQREAPSDTSPEGQIVGQSPEAGKEVQTGASVSVTVSSGPQEKAGAAPSGQSGAEAAQAQTASKDGSATADQREREPRRLAAWVIFASVATLAVVIVGALIVANNTQPQDDRSDQARNNPPPSRVAEEETPTFTLDRTLSGHSDWVNSVAFSPDGKLLASSSPDVTIKVWDPQSGEELQTLSGDSDLINSVAFSPDGKLLAGGSHADTIKLWDPQSGEVLRTLSGHSGRVNSVAFSPDGKLLASGSWDETIKVWDPQSGEELRTLSGHSNSVKTVAFSPDGKLLASGSYDETIKLWDPQSGEVLRTLSGHSDDSVTAGGRVTAVAFSPDGKFLASGSWDETIKLWDPQSGEVLRTLSGHSDRVTAVAFSPDGKFLASGSHDKTVKLWDPQSGKELQTLSGHSNSVVTVAFSPGGKLLASGSYDETIKLWETAEEEP